jgi:hypothetical protein
MPPTHSEPGTKFRQHHASTALLSIVKGAGWISVLFLRVRKTSLQLVFDARTHLSIASRYTDYAVWAAFLLGIEMNL